MTVLRLLGLQRSSMLKPRLKWVIISLTFTLLASYLLHAEFYGAGAQMVIQQYIPTDVVKSAVISDLLDTELYIPSHGKSLINANESLFGPYEMTLPQIIHAGEEIKITFSCDSSIVGTPTCPWMYQVHFHGPIAFSVPANKGLYKHDKKEGTVTVTTRIPQAGKYEIWAWPSWAGNKDPCPFNNEQYMGPNGITAAVKGSGTEILTVEENPYGGFEEDEFRECKAMDYASELKGRWISMDHVKGKYRGLAFFKRQMARMGQLYPYGAIPDYVYAPYQCKHRVMDYPGYAASIPDLSHVVFIGDSHTRMRYCGHIYPALHDGEDDGRCRFFIGDQHKHADRKFPHTTPDGRTVYYSQRFIARPLKTWWHKIDGLSKVDPPISHVVINSGFWWGRDGESGHDTYREDIKQLMERLVKAVGRNVKIMWITTPSVTVAAKACDRDLKRHVLKDHGDWAREAIHHFREKYPDVEVGFIDAFPLYDNRPETTQEGRHWVKEGPHPSLDTRPHVGRADHAMIELVFDAWRVGSTTSRPSSRIAQD